MNKNRQILTSKLKKSTQKAVKKAQKAFPLSPDLPRTDTLTSKTELKKYPSKVRKVEKPLVEATAKNMVIKKKKKAAKHSKRATPGDVSHRDSTPKSVHSESKRWEVTTKLQSRIQSKALTKKLQKRQAKH